MHQLDHDQLAMLVTIVTEESGDKLTRVQFNDAVGLLFENIAGFESLSRIQAKHYLIDLWKMYQSRPNQV